MNASRYRQISGFIGAGLLAMAAFSMQPASAAVSISQIPLFVTTQVPPNIVLTLDNSGSMLWAFVPDSYGKYGSATVQTLSYTNVCTGNGNNKTCAYEYLASGWKSYSSVYIPDTFHFKSSAYNALYYDPTVTYTAPKDASGNTLTTSFTAAYVNGYDTALGTVDLSTSYEATVGYDPSTDANTLMNGGGRKSYYYVDDEVNSCNGFYSGSCQSIHNPGPAFYYTYNPASGGTCASGTADLTNDSCYTEHTVSSTSGTGGTDERQNFAIWFSFYRTRNLTTVTGADLAFSSLDQTYRVAWQDLPNGNTNTGSGSGHCSGFYSSGCDDWTGNSNYDNRIGIFTDDSTSVQPHHRSDFFNWLMRLPATGGTPLRVALEQVGQYYTATTTDNKNGPYAYDPQNTDSPELICRPNYAIVMTDGLWNDSDSDLSKSYGNLDDSSFTLPDNTKYTPAHPYEDSTGNTLADIAFYYWATNLYPGNLTTANLEYTPYTQSVTVKDSVGNFATVSPYLNPQNDPASWPHMVTFTVGLGMSSSMTTAPAWGGTTYSGGYNDLITGNNSWPSVSSNSSNNVWDLWHAAIDSRGQFFSADSPQDVVSAFNNIVKRITGRVGSSSAIAVNSTRLDANTAIYQAQFNSATWTGDVLAYSINSDGSVATSPTWQASNGIPALSSRNIYTWSDSANAGINFYVGTATTPNNFANLSTSEQLALNTEANGTVDTNGADRLAYIAGDQSKELANSGSFRNRSSLLGDIVNSNPDYVGDPDFGFSNLPGNSGLEGSTYAAFVTTNASRKAVLYVGANDGMLHAIDASNGEELFAYVPRGVYSNLSELTDPGYGHQYFVDGSPTEVDAYLSDDTWHSLLAGSTGAGGRDVFVLDVTNPTSFSASDVLWDYDGATNSDANMGYSIGQPTIARMNDGDWYVIFGNGYNSPNNDALLYMYNLDTKKLITFDTKTGSSTAPNGMSSPLPVDTNSDRIADAVYAGDLQGNLWKIDVSSTNPSSWGFALQSGNGNNATPAPLFKAHDDNNNVQPITDRPQAARDNLGRVMIYFGTGTYFQVGDNTVPSNPPVQSFYGIVDTGTGVVSTNQVTRATDSTNQLLKQTILAETTVNGNNIRVTSNNSMPSGDLGWYIDLNYPSAQGERVVSTAIVHSGRIIFTTVIPEGNDCDYGGNSWLMELDSSSGSRLTDSPFELNGDGKVNSGDYVTVTVNGQSITVPASGKESTVGIIQTPGIISAGELEYKYYSGSTGKIGETTESAPNSTTGRLSWQQLAPKP